MQARSSWTRKAAHEAICKGLGLKPGKTISEMLDQIAEELALSGKPLVIDEADFLVEHKQIEIVRDIYEASQAPIMLIGEEWLPGKLEKWERFHGRVLDWCPAQPVSFEDVKALCRLYATGTEIADDLLQRAFTRCPTVRPAASSSTSPPLKRSPQRSRAAKDHWGLADQGGAAAVYRRGSEQEGVDMAELFSSTPYAALTARERIWAAIREMKTVTVREVADRCDAKADAVGGYFTGLVAAGVLT